MKVISNNYHYIVMIVTSNINVTMMYYKIQYLNDYPRCHNEIVVCLNPYVEA